MEIRLVGLLRTTARESKGCESNVLHLNHLGIQLVRMNLILAVGFRSHSARGNSVGVFKKATAAKANAVAKSSV